MKIASYNLWNSESGLPLRKRQIVDEILSLDSELICLQEVKSKSYCDELASNCDYLYSYFANHEGEDEGLGIFSKIPIIDKRHIHNAIICTFYIGKQILLVGNVHLSWDSVLKREQEICSIIDFMSQYKADYAILAGDFNCSDDSSTQRFLLGEQTLLNKEANPCWYDLAKAYAELQGTNVENTLDFRNNARFKFNNTIEINQRYDRILLRNTYPSEFPVLKQCYIFGREISNESGYSASDHYGICTEIEF